MANIIQRVASAIVNKPAPGKHIVPIQTPRIVQDSQTRKDAIAEAERPYFPYRYKLQQLYLNTTDNLHILACMDRRKDLTLLRKFEIKNTAGEIDEKTSLIFCDNNNGNLVPKTWFNNFINYVLDAEFYGYSLIYLNDIIDGSFKKLEVVKRWNVSPDRFEVMSFPYMVSGIKFLEDEQFKDWYVYIPTPNPIGVSPCGYGLLYYISIAEIFLRNLLGFNGTFVELFAQPFRHGKTNHTNGPERDAFEQALINMGSSGWAITDPTDEINLIESALGGTGYKSYDNLESRLQKLVSKLILGHADAIDSTPGKLGSGNAEDNPVYKAMRDKQIKDGAMVEGVIQGILFTNLRNLGFNIPDGTTFGYKNDAEVMENADSIASLAIKMKNGGLQMDADYFEEQTGIKSAVVQAPTPFVKPMNFNKKILNKLNAIYG